METTCAQCNLVIPIGEAKIDLLCGHSGHTRCLLQSVIRIRDIQDLTCSTCNIPIFSDFLFAAQREEDEVTEEMKIQKIRDKYWENTAFRQGVRDYVKSIRSTIKARNGLLKVIKQKKSAIHTEITAIKEQIRQLIDPYKNTIKTLAEYKGYNLARSRTKRALQKLQEIENISKNDLRSALNRQHGLRVWPNCWRYRQSATRIINNKFYYRIRI
jgi:hypothetical protein